MESVNDILVKVFQQYCSFGDPLNTERLKSSKLVRLFNDMSLLWNHEERLTQANQSVMTQSTVKRQQYEGPYRRLDKQEIDLIFKRMAAQKTQGVNFLQRTKGAITSREGSVPRQQPVVEANQSSLSFQEFLAFLLEATKAMLGHVTDEVEMNEQCAELIKVKLLPLAVSNNDDRCIQNGKIAQMLRLLEGEEVITLLSDLHGVISPLFEIYADRRSALMDFEAFMRFCSDFQIFPDVISKSDAYRIFMNLAFAHESKSKGDAFNNTRKLFESRTSMISSKRSSVGGASGALTTREQ